MPSPTPPIALEPCTMQQVLHFCLRHPATHKHLLVCSSRDDFLHDLLDEVQQEQEQSSSPLNLLAPTLHNLQASRNINVAFCHDLANIHAYLSKLVHEPPLLATESKDLERLDQVTSLLVVVNPIRLHEPTSSYSAQGFSKTFAAIVETAHCLDQQLVLVECAKVGAGQTVEDEILEGDVTSSNAWDEAISMLNVTTKTFGAGERGWMGRTIKIRQVLERWCKFVTLEEYDRNTHD